MKKYTVTVEIEISEKALVETEFDKTTSVWMQGVEKSIHDKLFADYQSEDVTVKVAYVNEPTFTIGELERMGRI